MHAFQLSSTAYFINATTKHNCSPNGMRKNEKKKKINKIKTGSTKTCITLLLQFKIVFN